MNSMQVYTYNPVTKEYLYPSTAFEDAMNPGEYLIPADSTVTAPPMPQDGYSLLWQGGQWVAIEDHREKINNETGAVLRHAVQYWLPGDNYESQSRKVTDIGPLPQGATLTAPVPTTEELAEQVRGERDVRLMATDYLLMQDYKTRAGLGLGMNTLALIEEYRQALRNITVQPGFPWGGRMDAPWPVNPVSNGGGGQ